MTQHDARALIPVASSAVPALLAPDLDKAADLARQEKAKGTRRAYRTDFAIFEAWCASRSVSALPATGESVSAFLACEVERGIRPSTIGRRVAAIRYAHKFAGHAVPTDDERVKARFGAFAAPLAPRPGRKHRRPLSG